MKSFTNIPVSLIEYALVNRKINQLKLYVYLKMNCEGYIVYDETSCKKWATEMGVTKKTITSSLNWLFKNGWITGNRKRFSIRIISYKKLSLKLQIGIKTGFLFEPYNFKTFKALCCAVVITYYLFRKRFFNRRSGNIKGFPITNCPKTNGFYAMSNLYLAKCIGVSLATACRYKQEAEKVGYIKTKAAYSFLGDKNGNRISVENFEVFQYNHAVDGLPNRVRKGKKYLKQVEADQIYSYLKCKKKQYEIKGKN